MKLQTKISQWLPRLLLINYLLISNNLFSQDVLPASSYCNDDLSTYTFRRTTPTDKVWSCIEVPAAVTDLPNGECYFTPSLVPGPYPRTIHIQYHNVGTGYYTVIIMAPPVVTFDVINDVCENSTGFDLKPRGLPAGGIYSCIDVPGSVVGDNFFPAVATAGIHSLMYVYPTSGCTDTAYQTVTVKSVPAITFNHPAPG